jgi:hypothetical protein
MTRSIIRGAGLAAAVLVAPACGGSRGDEGSGVLGPPPPPPGVTDGIPYVSAHLGRQGGMVYLLDNQVEVTGATVTLNGAGPVGVVGGSYEMALATPVAPGGAMTLSITYAGAVVLGTATAPPTPVLTAPASGGDFVAGQDLMVTWTADADPDEWVLVLLAPGDFLRNFRAPSFRETDGSARAITIPGGVRPGRWEVRLVARNEVRLSGELELESVMTMQELAAPAPIITVSP